MKKLIIYIIALAIIALAAFFLIGKSSPVPATAKDSANVISIMNRIHNTGGSIPVIASGEKGDFLVRLPVARELKRIAARKKTVEFLSIENPEQYIMEGYVLLNIIPTAVMAELGMPENTCFYRLFYGSKSDMIDGVYAVELCE